jgi:16S rRNA (cytosine967-C5)-methyltransferase
MKPSARVHASIEVLDSIVSRHQTAAIALADWGKANRYAGSGDRAAIGNVVYDALRHRAFSAHHMRSDSPRALVLGALVHARGLETSAIEALFDGSKHGPAALTGDERTRVTDGADTGAADWQLANVPRWVYPLFQRSLGAKTVAEGRAMAQRAPVDLRVNTEKAQRAQVLEALKDFGAVETPHSPLGLRIAAPSGDGRTPNVEAEAAHGLGWFEVQDEGSQIAAALASPRPGEQVLDLCAGAGGKTLAIAAQMKNTGKIYAYDSDKSRLRPIYERLTRAGVTNVDVMTAGDTAALDALGAKFDLVLVDAPCSGTGTWRRKPDAKWRLKPEVLVARQKDQAAVLMRAGKMVKPGGRLVYVTCSLLAEENTDQISRFLSTNSHFSFQPWRDAWVAAFGKPPQHPSADGREDSLLLSPALHGTDGFFVAVLRRRL